MGKDSRFRGLRGWFDSKDRLRKRVEALEAEALTIRAKVEVERQAKIEAVNQAEALRRQKEKIRARLNELRQSEEHLRKLNSALYENIAELKATNEDLVRRLNSRG